jgi:rhodanese-related sulfurtransferase
LQAGGSRSQEARSLPGLSLSESQEPIRTSGGEAAKKAEFRKTSRADFQLCAAAHRIPTENIETSEEFMSQSANNPSEITATELKQRIDNGDDIQIIDVREQVEYDVARIPNSKLIPLGQVLNRMDEIDQTRETVVHCKGGGRSARAIEALKRAGFTGSLTNLHGGIMAWSNEVDPSVPKY